MKKNLIYLAGALLSSAILTFSCSEDDIPSYSDVSVDKNDLFIKIENPTAEVNITNGNGNYKVTVADESIATATLDGTRITINGLKNGTTTATVMDWAKRSAVINIRVKEDFELKLDKEEVTLFPNNNEKNKALVNIISGNGDYQVESDNAQIAIAELNEAGELTITAIDYGFANITVTDADGNKKVIKVISAEHELTFNKFPEGTTWGIGETKNITILSGNGEYTVKSDHEEIASAELVNDNTIKVTGRTEGDATITVSDKMGVTQTITIRVVLKLVTITNIDEVVINETVELDLLSGGSDFTITITDGATGFSKDPKIECTISDDHSKLLIKGLSRGWSQVINLTDNGIGQSADITVQTVDVPFYTKTKRYFINSWFANDMAVAKHETADNKERIIMANKKGGWISPDTPVDGWIISFTGGMNADVNPKGDPVLGHIDSKGKEDQYYEIDNLRIVKVEDNWYWIKFRQKGNEFDSYMVLPL